MSRDEEFSDIPDLGPADEERLNQSIPTLESSQSVKPQAVSSAQPTEQVTVVQKKGASPLLWILVVLLAAGLGFSFYQNLLMQKQLSFSEDALLQTQSRLADLESLVNATDESTSKTGAAFLAQLKRQQNDREARISHVDSEIRKLWAIYQKYKPTIDNLDKSLKSQEQQLALAKQQADKQQLQISKHASELTSQQKELKTVGGSLDSVGVSLDKQRDELAKLSQSAEQASAKLKQDVSELQESLRLLNLEQQESNDLQDAELADLKAKVASGEGTKALKVKLDGLEKTVNAKLDEHQKSLNSINTSRRQINAEILKLRNQLGRMQSVPAS